MFILTKKGLENYLLKFGISSESWGKGNSKTINHLLQEILKGESNLVIENKKLIREVSALSIVVTHKDMLLKEDHQEFNDGRIRRRKMKASVAEKIDKNDKNLNEAVKRAIREELGIEIQNNQIKETEISSSTRMSMSYPELQSRVKLYGYSIDFNDDQYNSEGYMEIQEDKKTIFLWTKNKQSNEVS